MHASFRWVILAGLVLLAGCSSMNPFSRKAPGNEPAALVKFAPSMTTRTVWTAQIGKSGDYPLVPAVVDTRVFAASAGGEISCLNTADGKPVWKIKAGTELTAGVGTDGKVLVVAGADGLILAFDAADGKPLWKAQASTEVLSTPALGSGVVVIRSMDNRIAAYDLASGTRRWFVQRTAPPLALRASPGILINDDIAFVALPAGRLLALAAQTGAPMSPACRP
jgi:outer membrane protein assembly factor BamB